MIIDNILLRCSSLLILLLFLQTSLAIDQTMNPHICSPSSCGIILNISFPFRLKDDPQRCGHPRYELECENNVSTILYLNSRGFKVKSINYHNYTIRLVDVYMNSSSCSFPKYSLYEENLYHFDGYTYYTLWFDNSSGKYWTVSTAWPINFMSCSYPLKNSSLLTELPTDCAYGDNFLDASNSSSTGKHTYIKVGRMKASDVKYMCSVDLIVMTSWNFKDLKNVSVSEIHESLLYGFELSWFKIICRECNGEMTCPRNDSYLVTCNHGLRAMLHTLWDNINASYYVPKGSGPSAAAILIMIILFVLVALSAGVSLPGMIIIGFICACGFIFLRREITLSKHTVRIPTLLYLVSPLLWLRSGHDVAVKLLKKPGANGQDFMNEIATIGRIHHVNVVKLVGYCAERSKRALVFDFMPNGSLEKYIYKGEKMNSLNWKTKYDIAVGVARGIEYLHRGCDIQILHFDIKPHNILLDDKFIPKISDFGLAKYFSTEKDTVTLTAVRGTIGYVAPELINRGFGGVSYKADVYSFGMLLIDMVGLNRNLAGKDDNSSQYFPDWIYSCFDQGNDIEIGKIDEENDEGDNDETRKIARKMTIMALWLSPAARPSMNKVVEMLEGEVERLQIPRRHTQSLQVVADKDQSSSTYSTDSMSLLSHDAAPNFEITVQDY